MSSGEMTCCSCKGTFPAPPAKNAGSLKCPQCGEPLVRVAQDSALGGNGLWVQIRLVLAALAVAVLVIGGISIFRRSSERVEKPQLLAQAAQGGAGVATSPAAKSSSASSRPAVAHSRISIYHNRPGARATVALGMPFGARESTPYTNARAGILERELIRQALLIAARDELGLLTRDDVLGERQNDQAPASTGREIQTISGLSGLIRVVIDQAEGGGAAPLLELDLTKKPEGTAKAALSEAIPEDLANLAARTEELSRSEFPAVLRKLGLDGKPNEAKIAGQVPEVIEDRLGALGFAEVFAAVKDLHALVRSDGESRARTGALVRGYALLGLLSEFQWHPAHKAYKARALLYAQRLVARQPKEAWGLWHRAFALALAGLHSNAIADLKAAEAGGEPAAIAARPAWVEPISALVRCDDKALQSQAGPHSKLASLLRLTVLEFPPQASTTLPAASDVISLEPDCFRAIDAICAFRAVSTLQIVMTIGPAALEEVLPRKLKGIEGLPLSVQTFVKNPGSSVELAKLLERAARSDQDAGELSWSALGHLIRETQFLHVYRRLVYMKAFGNMPRDEFWAQVRGSIAGHPLEPFLRLYSLAPGSGPGPVDSVVKQFDTMNLEPTSAELFGLNNTALGSHARAFRGAIEKTSDHVVRDLSLRIRYALQMGGPPDPSSGRLLFAVSPHSQYAKSILIENDWDRAQPHVAEWEKEASRSPALLGAIARRYQGLGKTDDAERLLLEYIKQWPDYWAYEKLAEIHAQRHNTSRWLEVLERFLAEGSDSGFDKAAVRVAIADYYMKQKQWDMARPHAEAAAATGAVWAMICAQNCAEGRKDWKQAEKWARAISERYPSEAWDRWFTLCRKTGTGDIEAAFAFTSKWVTENEKAAAPDIVARIAAFYLSSFQLKKALPALGRWYEGSPSAGVGAIAWLVADLLDDHAARDRYFELMENLEGTDAPQMAAIWRLFREAIDRDGGGSLDLPAIAKEQENSQSGNTWLIDFIIGMFLQKHGKPVEAREFLQKVVDNPAISEPFAPVARDTIRKLDENAKNTKANGKPTAS